ncbi:MAG: PorV/PorQ family protein [Candidatus Latescibacterota bacterium]
MLRITKHALLALVGAGLVWGAGAVQAEGYNRAGTAAAPELLIPVGARDMALGGASIASTSGIEAIHWNPAGLARAESDANAMFSTMSYLADMNVNYLAVSARFPRLGSLALSLKALDAGKIDVTTERQPDGTGGTFSPTFFTLGLTYARELTDRIALGTTVHYISNTMDRVDASSVAFSAGLQYLNLGNIDGLDLGVAVKHIGKRMRYEGPGLTNRGSLPDLRRPPAFYNVEASSADLPSVFEIGVGYRYPTGGLGQLNLSSVFQHHNYNYDQYRAGAEYVLNDFLALRGGFDYAADAADDTHLFGTSYGLGLAFDLGGKLEDVRLDYAYTAAEHFDALNTFTFQVGF